MTKTVRYCSECEFTSYRSSNLRRHVKRFHTVGIFKCNYCHVVLQTKFALHVHLNITHTDRPPKAKKQFNMCLGIEKDNKDPAWKFILKSLPVKKRMLFRYKFEKDSTTDKESQFYAAYRLTMSDKNADSSSDCASGYSSGKDSS